MVLPVSEEEFEKAGSKFVTFPAGAKPGDVELRNIEMGMPDWKQQGVSIQLPVTITEEGVDQGKEDNLFCGVTPDAVWKLKAVLSTIGVGYKKVGKNVAFNSEEVVGKPAVGVWTWQKGTKGGVEGGEPTFYSKLTDIQAPDTKTEALL